MWLTCFKFTKKTHLKNQSLKKTKQPQPCNQLLGVVQRNSLAGFQSLKQVFFSLNLSTSIAKILVPAILSIQFSVVGRKGILTSVIKLSPRAQCSQGCTVFCFFPYHFLLQLYPEMFFVLFSVQSLSTINNDPG